MPDDSALVRFAERELGLRLHPGQRELLASFELGGYREAVWRCGRRSGKSLLADVVALYDVAVRDLSGFVRPGEIRTAAIICPRLDQAQDHISSIQGLIDDGNPRLRGLIDSVTAESITLVNRTRIRALPASARGIRGGAWSSLVLDELAHFLDTENNASGDAILSAAAPSLAQFGREGWQIAISTPLWQAGAFHRLDERARSGRFAHMMHAHRPTWEMNPSIPDWFIEEKRQEDPELFVREYAAEFLDGAASYLTAADVAACVRGGERASPPRLGAAYRASVDPGYMVDSFALCIGHKDDGLVYVDGVWTWKKHGHEATLDAVRDICKQYRVQAVTTDQGAGVQPVLEGLQRRGLAVRYAPWSNESKTRAFSAVKVGLSTRSLSLPDDAALVEELCTLEARPTPSGAVRIAASGSRHDDRATALAALVDELASYGRSTPEEARRLLGLNQELRHAVPASVRAGLGALGLGEGPLPL